ncbi:MAG: hypothetical protein AAF298_03405 [Cyanobacteria bacterium P01_A01_bin.40]
MPKLNIIDYSARYLLFLTLLSLGVSPELKAQEAVNPADAVESTENIAEPDSSETSSQFDSIFSIEGGKRLMAEADQAIDAQEYSVAAEKLQSARQVYNQLSNFYFQLFNSVSGLDNAAAESHRKKALETSIERDKATYQLALVHRAQNKSELSIPLLVQIVTSQSPLSGLGKKAYEQLLEIGFVDTPIAPPANRETTPPESQPPANPPTNIPPATPQSQPTIPNPQTP